MNNWCRSSCSVVPKLSCIICKFLWCRTRQWLWVQWLMSSTWTTLCMWEHLQSWSEVHTHTHTHTHKPRAHGKEVCRMVIAHAPNTCTKPYGHYMVSTFCSMTSSWHCKTYLSYKAIDEHTIDTLSPLMCSCKRPNVGEWPIHFTVWLACGTRYLGNWGEICTTIMLYKLQYVSLLPRSHPLTRKNRLAHQVDFLCLACTFETSVITPENKHFVTHPLKNHWDTQVDAKFYCCMVQSHRSFW